MKKEKTREIKPVSKTKIMFAWLLLIILIFLAGGISYLKFFSNFSITEQKAQSNTNEVSPVVLGALQTIVDNFNKSEQINDYKKKNINVKASLDDTNIIIEYESQDNQKQIYKFEFDLPNLYIIVDSSDSNFSGILRTIVYANQIRLGNENNIDSYLISFINDEEDVIGLSKEKSEANKITYIVDISKIIGADNTEQNNTNEKAAEQTNTNTNEEGEM